MASHDQSLILQLLSNVPRGRARNLNPGLGEDSTSSEHENDVHSCMDWVQKRLLEVEWWGHIVGNSGGSKELSRSLLGFPNTEKTDEDVVGETTVEHLGHKEDVGTESGLEHDGHVGGVEKADRECSCELS